MSLSSQRYVKFLSILALVFSLGLTACNDDKKDSGSNTEQTDSLSTATTDAREVGISIEMAYREESNYVRTQRIVTIQYGGVGPTDKEISSAIKALRRMDRTLDGSLVSKDAIESSRELIYRTITKLQEKREALRGLKTSTN